MRPGRVASAPGLSPLCSERPGPRSAVPGRERGKHGGKPCAQLLATIKAFRSCHPSIPSSQANPRTHGLLAFSSLLQRRALPGVRVMFLRLSLSTQARLFTHATHSKCKPAASLEGVSHTHPARPWQSRQGEAGRPRPHSGYSAHRDTLAGKTMTLPPIPPVSCDGTSIRLLAGGGLRALPLNVAGLCDYLIRSAWPGHSLRVFLGPSCHTARKPDRPVGRPEDMCRCPSHRPG